MRQLVIYSDNLGGGGGTEGPQGNTSSGTYEVDTFCTES
jgi:hypothetical protein